MSPPRTAAVVLARDRPSVVARTIEAIVGQEPAPDVLILVANEATPEVTEVLERAAHEHDAGEVLHLPTNLGAAGGFHAGLEHAMSRGDVELACCFDDDATPLPGCLAALLAAAAALPDVGTVGAVAHDGTGKLSWGMWIDGQAGPAETVGEVQQLAAGRQALDVAGMCWHALLVPVDVLRAHGNIWAELFLQYEDAEFGLRLRAAGLHNYLVPAAECVHPPAPPSREIRLLGRKLAITCQAPGKEYLTLRNDLLVRHRYNGLRFWYATGPLILVRGLLIAVSLDVPRSAALRHVFARAVLDAARGRLGPPPARTTALEPAERRAP